MSSGLLTNSYNLNDPISIILHCITRLAACYFTYCFSGDCQHLPNSAFFFHISLFGLPGWRYSAWLLAKSASVAGVVAWVWVRVGPWNEESEALENELSLLQLQEIKLQGRHEYSLLCPHKGTGLWFNKYIANGDQSPILGSSLHSEIIWTRFSSSLAMPREASVRVVHILTWWFSLSLLG